MVIGEKNPDRLKVLELLEKQYGIRRDRALTESRHQEQLRIGEDSAKLAIVLAILREMDWI